MMGDNSASNMNETKETSLKHSPKLGDKEDIEKY